VKLNYLVLCMTVVVPTVGALHVLWRDGGNIDLYELAEKDLSIDRWIGTYI
jgi:hypothetical protein